MGLATVFMFKPTQINTFRHLNIKKYKKLSQNIRKSVKTEKVSMIVHIYIAHVTPWRSNPAIQKNPKKLF